MKHKTTNLKLPNELKKVINDYIFGMNESNYKKILNVFDKNSSIVGFINNKNFNFDEESFASFISKQKPLSKDKMREIKFEIILCEIHEKNCNLIIKNVFLNHVFLDTLFLKKINNKWKIINKLFLGSKLKE